MARTCTNNLRVVLSPCEALEQKWSEKPKILKSKEIELSFLFHSIRLDELVILVYSFVKIGLKMAKLRPCKAPILGHKKAIFGVLAKKNGGLTQNSAH